MSKKKQLTLDSNTGKLSRLKSKDLPLIGISGINDGDELAAFGTLQTDVIEYHIYNLNDTYVASGEIKYPLPNKLDVGSHVRNLGYSRGTYKVVYNFLRQIGGSSGVVLTKKEDKSLYAGPWMIHPNGKIVASHSPTPDVTVPLLDDNLNEIELLVQDDKFWLQEISPSRTEIRIRPNPAINDLDYFEQFRVLGYTCLSYSDVTGDAYINIEGNTATITGTSISLTDAMENGTLKIRDALVLDVDETPQIVTRYNPVIETEQFQPSENLITNGHFPDNGSGQGTHVLQHIKVNTFPKEDIVEFLNPGHSKYSLRMTSVGGSEWNQYRLRITNLIPGEAYIASCWVHWTDDWDSFTDQGVIFIRKSDAETNIINYNIPASKSEERIVDGNVWKRLYGSFIAEEDTIIWILGYNGRRHRVLPDGPWQGTDGNLAGYRYFTDIQLEPGTIGGAPSPYMITERPEETDIPTTGQLVFLEDNKIEANISDQDEGFNERMSGNVEGFEQGILTVKDAYVVDEVFTQETEMSVIDDVPLKNQLATDIKKYEREYRVSPYHGTGTANRIWIRVDNNFTITSYDENNNPTEVGTSFGVQQAWMRDFDFPLPDNTERLEIQTRENTGQAGFIARVTWNGEEYRTGDGEPANVSNYNWQRDNMGGSEEEDAPPPATYSASSGPFRVISNSTNPNDLEWRYTNASTTNISPKLRDSRWIWASNRTDNQDLVWEWRPESEVTDFIWRFPDPILRSDAVWPEGWSEGFNSFDWGGNTDRINDRSFWHSGWLGHHAKWVQGEGQFGETCIKMIDKNNQFPAPNHENYPVDQPHKTGNVTTANSPNEKDTLRHRWMGIAQTLPHSMASQGIEVGSKITVSWWQKSDTLNKGAQVGIHHYKISNGGTTWGPGTGEGYHPLAASGVEYDGIPAGRAWQYEFLRYLPVGKVGEWEQVSYTGIVDEDWDLTKPSTIYIYGHKGPEGILWVENPTIELTEETSIVDRTPVTADLVAPIVSIQDGTNNTLVIDGTYESLAPSNAILDNENNIGQFGVFNQFYVDYTSSLYNAEPVFGTLRADIESVSGNTITLKKNYQDLATEAGHEFDKYPLNSSMFDNLRKWFVQYPLDKSEDLSKLVKTSNNQFSLITNFKVDQTTYPEYPYSVVYKLYEPLPDNVQEKDFVTIVREMIPPVEETCTLVPFVEEWISDSVLRPPEPGDVTSPISSRQTGFKNYDGLVTSDANIKESIEDEIISGSFGADINVDYSQFENFIHFSSAEQRLKNFKRKLDLIEQYTDRSSSLAGTSSGSTGLHSVVADPGEGSYLTISGSSALNPSFTPISGSLTQIQHWEKKRREEINSFDKFEKYMFFESASYKSESIGIFNDNSWPKRSGTGTYSSPYVLYRTSQSLADTWYSNQLVSASNYDKANKHRLQGHLPMFVQDNDENTVFLKFVDMIGHHFDETWTYIKAMTDVHDKRDKLTEGLAKTLLEPAAKSLGWTVQDGKDLISLPQYMFGMQVSGSEKPQEYSITPDRDISREIWSRLLNNMPYFLKTKGTSRAIKGLISCYGIPSSILRVMEYGGPKLPDQPADHMITRRWTKALNFFGADNNTYVQNSSWKPVADGEAPTNRVPDTVEFRFKAVTGSNQVLVRRGTNWAIRLKDNGSVDNRGHVSFLLSGSRGYLEASSSNFPVYDGEFWSVMLTRTLSGSGAFLASDATNQDVVYSLYTKKYDSGRSKIIYESTNTLLISGSMGAVSQSYNLAYSGSGTTVTIGGPQENTYFGESFSGSIMEYRNWTTALQESAFDNHVAAPITFDGNTPSASYLDMVTRYSFDDDKDLSVGANQWFRDVSADQSFTSSAVPSGYTSGMGDHFSSVVDETKMKVPNLGPSVKSSNKVRIEADQRIDKFGNPVLKFGESITIPAYDNAPIDSNKLGIFFSPSAAIDEDIISSMPNLDFDQYIGDPRDQYKEQYTGLVDARNLYWKKYSGPNNFWDYLRLLKYYDNSLYKQVKDLIPARANESVGILIEPTILERDKIIIGKEPSIEPQHHKTILNIEQEYSESAFYQTYEDRMNWSNPYGLDKHRMVTGSYMSASGEDLDLYEVDINFLNEFETNWYTQESGSRQPRGLVSSSAMDVTPELVDSIPLNMYDPFKLHNISRLTGSSIAFSAELVSYNAPTETLSENAAGTGSFVLKHILERPAIYNIGSRDESGWYGNDYSGSTIQFGSVSSIFEEVVMPQYEGAPTSRLNDEIMYFYSSSISASKHLAYSSSFVRSDLDNKWDEAIGTDRLFYVGCVQTDETTVTDGTGTYEDNTPAVDVVLVSPTKLVTSDKPTTKMDVTNKK